MHGLRRADNRKGIARAVVSGVTALALVCALAATSVVVPTTARAQTDDLSAQLEAALEDAGATVYDSEYKPDIAGINNTRSQSWYLTINYQGKGGIVTIEQPSSADLAQQADRALTDLNANASVARINDISGHVVAQSYSDGTVSNSQASAWWVRDRYLVLVNLMPATDTGLVVDVAEVVDDVLSGAASDGGGSGEVPPEEPPEDPGITAGASPANFTALGDTVRIVMRLSGDDTADKPVTLSGHGVDLYATTDFDGAATFTITHYDETATEYRYTVTAEGMSREVVVPVLALQILPEANPATGEPFAGVVADSRSTLAIEIDLGSDAGGTLSVASPQVGTLGGSALGESGAVTLFGGKAAIEFTPPAYLDAASLTERVTPLETSGATLSSARTAQTVYVNDGIPWAATVPLTFTYSEPGGGETEVALDVLVARPPVMLVHGFTGDQTTWTALQRFLGERRFDAVINEYYVGDQGIHDQAEQLGKDIGRELGRYADLGLKASRVDVVGHSMGGLIARDYAYGLPPHPDDVRKLIMVGTPNHGATFTDKLLGNLATEWSRDHALASEQLYSGSAFMAQINDGEAGGRHLAPEVQYGNIYGVRSDWVVTQSSAWLNGVASHKIAGVKHSTAIPLVTGVSITESNEVLAWVAEWLGTDIPRVALRDTKAEVVAGDGDVYISGLDANGKETREAVTAFPRTIQPWEHVETGPDSRARIRLSVAGLAWGSIDLAPDSLIALGNLTPDAATVRVRRGSARFRSLKRDGGGHFEVVLGETDPGKWMTLHPDAKVIGLDTDFVASADAGGEAEVLVLEGRALFDDGTAEAEDDMLELGAAQAGVVGGSGDPVSQLAEDQWWTDGFYRPSLIEVLREWWAIFMAQFEDWNQGGA